MQIAVERATIYLSLDLPRPLKARPAGRARSFWESFSNLFQEVRRLNQVEDSEDQKAFRERAPEPPLALAEVLQDLGNRLREDYPESEVPYGLMKDYRILVKPSVVHDLQFLPEHARKTVIRRIRALSSDPRPPDSQGFSSRLRRGNCRILYAIDHTNREAVVVKVALSSPAANVL